MFATKIKKKQVSNHGAYFGAGIGIGRIGGQAMDAMARQPEKMGDLRSSMIIAAALVEGVAFFAVIIAILAIVM